MYQRFFKDINDRGSSIERQFHMELSSKLSKRAANDYPPHIWWLSSLMIVIIQGRHHLWSYQFMIVYMDDCCLLNRLAWLNLNSLITVPPSCSFSCCYPFSSQIKIRLLGAAHCRWVFQCCFTAAASTALHWHYVHLSIENKHVHTFSHIYQDYN